MTTNDIWTKTLAQIEVKLDSSAQFKTWFKDTKLAELKGRDAIIQVKNPYTSDWLRNRHSKLITETISYVVGKPLRVRFEINGQLADPAGEVEESAQEPLMQTYTQTQPSVTKQVKASGLNERYSLENYIVGESNKLAHAAALAIVDTPGETYNPLFIYGPTGIGKTHLAQGIGQGMIARNPSRKIVYTPTEGFLNDMVKAIRQGRNIEFRQKYRQIDCLIIDDVQFISTMEKTQDEFFNTFNELYNANKQIIIISDRKPEEIKSIDQRLRTRFMGGLTVDIGKPDLAMRLAILQHKARETGINLAPHVYEYLAKTITDSIRELEGSIKSVSLYSNLKPEPLTIEEIAKIIGRDSKSKRKQTSIAQILKMIAEEFEVHVKDIKGPRRTKEVAFARQVAMYVLREEFEYKLERIAEILNRKDHTTVIHAVDKVASKIALSDGFAEQIANLRERIRNLSPI